jgi:Na+-driven multidrug efflux pump
VPRAVSLPALSAEVARLAGPAIVQGLLHTVVLFTDRLLLGRYSADALASMQVSGPLLWSVFSVLGALGAGVLAAQKLGAGRPDDAARGGWTAAGVGVAGLLAVSLLFLLVPERLVGLLSADPQVVALGASCLRVAAIAQPLMALADTLASSLRGAGDVSGALAGGAAGPRGRPCARGARLGSSRRRSACG